MEKLTQQQVEFINQEGRLPEDLDTAGTYRSVPDDDGRKLEADELWQLGLEFAGPAAVMDEPGYDQVITRDPPYRDLIMVYDEYCVQDKWIIFDVTAYDWTRHPWKDERFRRNRVGRAEVIYQPEQPAVIEAAAALLEYFGFPEEILQPSPEGEFSRHAR